MPNVDIGRKCGPVDAEKREGWRKVTQIGADEPETTARVISTALLKDRRIGVAAV